MRYNKKLSSEKKIERLTKENDSLRSKSYFLELENKRLSSECENLYKHIEEVNKLEVFYNEEIKKLKEMAKKCKKEMESYIAIRSDYQRAMDKFLDTLVVD